MENQRIFKTIVALIVIMAIAGCGTIISRTPGPMQSQNAGIYNGVRTDLSMIQSDNDMGVVAALDVPLSIVTDSVLLPLDIVTWWARYDPKTAK